MMTGEYEFDGIFLGGECADGFATEAEAVANCLPFADLLYPMMVLFVVLVSLKTHVPSTSTVGVAPMNKYTQCGRACGSYLCHVFSIRSFYSPSSHLRPCLLDEHCLDELAHWFGGG
jgi:hypothetical protein